MKPDRVVTLGPARLESPGMGDAIQHAAADKGQFDPDIGPASAGRCFVAGVGQPEMALTRAVQDDPGRPASDSRAGDLVPDGWQAAGRMTIMSIWQGLS